MKVSENLHQLIKSLTPHEKRYLKLYCQLQRGEKKYLKLFDLIDDQKRYNEAKVKQNLLGDPKLSSNLPVVKNYLYKLILKSLRLGQSEKDIDYRIYDFLKDVQILERKGLYEQAKRALNKAQKLAIQYHRLHLLVYIQRKQISYLFTMKETKLNAKLNVLKKQFILLNREFHLESKLFVFYYRINMLERSKMYSPQEADQLIHDWQQYENSHEFDTINSFYSQYLLESINASVAKLRNDPQKRLKHYQRVIQIWEAHPAMIETEPNVYKIHLSNLLNCYFANKEWTAFADIISKIKAIPIHNYAEGLGSFMASAFNELLYFLNTRKFQNAIETLAEITEGLETYKAGISKSRELSFYYNISILYFMLNDFDSALLWLNRIVQHPSTDHRKDVQRFAQLLQIIYHYELGNILLLSHLLESVKRKLRAKTILSPFEKILLDSMLEIIKEPSPKNRIDLFGQLHKTILVLSKKRYMVGMEEVMIWLEKKTLK